MNQDGSNVYGGAQVGAFQMTQYDVRFDRLKSSSFDPRDLWDRLNGDVELLRDMVEIFLEQYPGMLQGIAAAIERGSFQDVQKSSHSLRGAALNLSGVGAATLAESLERKGQEKSLQGATQVLASLEREIAVLAESLHSMVCDKGEAAN